MKSKLSFCAIAVLLAVLGTATAVSFSGKIGESAGEVQFSGSYKLDDSTELSVSSNLDSGNLIKKTIAQGSGLNSLDESVSTKKNSVQNTIVSYGSMSTSSSSFGSNDGVLVNQDANLAGDMGFIGTKTVSPSNEMIVAGAYDGIGNLNEQASSYSGNVASIGGTISSAGVELLNNEMAQVVSSGEMDMALKGLTKSSSGATGQFGLVAVNRAKGASSPRQPSGYSVTPSGLTTTNDPNSPGEIMIDNLGALGSTSWTALDPNQVLKINSPTQIYLRADRNLARENLDATSTARSIATAAATWDSSTSSNLFTGKVIVSSNAAADTGDGYFVHAFKPISGNALAYARTWTFSGTNIIADSDVCYNTLNQWTLDWTKAKQGAFIDVQSIALHELGHGLGLGDLYWVDSGGVVHQTDKYQAMDAYDGPQRYLGAGDITGLQTIYGK